MRKQHTETKQVHIHLGEVPKPHLPVGWHIIDNILICNCCDNAINHILGIKGK
jgi:hypothetical protein